MTDPAELSRHAAFGPPPGGLRAAVDGGRKRRIRRRVGQGGAALSALTLLAVVGLSSLGGDQQDTLAPATGGSPTTSPTPVAAPATDDSPTPEPPVEPGALRPGSDGSRGKVRSPVGSPPGRRRNPGRARRAAHDPTRRLRAGGRTAR